MAERDDLTPELIARLQRTVRHAERIAAVPPMRRTRPSLAPLRAVALALAALLIVGAPITVAMLHARTAGAPAHPEKHPRPAPSPTQHVVLPPGVLPTGSPVPPEESPTPACYMGAPAARTPTPALGAIFVYDDALQSDVMFGGFPSSSSTSRETWLWHCGAWRQVHPPQSPPGWQNPIEGPIAVAAAYDAVHRVVVMYDEHSGTWTFDGSTWRNVSTEGLLLGSPVMAWDSTRRNLVMVGNRTSGTMHTLTWNGTAWQAHDTATAPDFRLSPVLMDDPRLHRVLLVGGTPPSQSTDGGTWEWDGSAWLHLPGPAPAEGTVGTYNLAEDTGVVVAADGTWTWDGLRWTQAHPQTEPPAATYRWAMYDGALRLLMLFGGKIDTSSGGSEVTTDIWVGGPPRANWIVMRGTTRAYN
jgi:hypothetical protein